MGGWREMHLRRYQSFINSAGFVTWAARSAGRPFHSKGGPPICLALGFGVLGLGRSSLAFLCSAVRVHRSRLSGLPSPDKATISAVVASLLSVAYAYEVGAR